MQKVALQEKLDLFDTYFDPKIVAELNGQHVKLVKFRGEFVWHKHDREDELFLVLKGNLLMKLRDGDIDGFKRREVRQSTLLLGRQGLDGLAEHAHLTPAVVEVVLARDVPARALEQARDAVPEHGLAPVSGRERSGGIRRV